MKLPNIFKDRVSLGCIALSALFYILSFPHYDLWPLIWVALVPYLQALTRAKTLREALGLGFLLNFLINVFGFYWVVYSIHNFGNVPYPIAVVMQLLWSCVNQPQLMIFALGFHVLWKRHQAPWVVPVLAMFYTGLDALLPKLFTDTAGHAFYLAPNLRQLSAVGGAYLLTTLALLHNVGLWYLLNGVSRPYELWPALRRAGPIYGGVLALILGSTLYGSMERSRVEENLAASTRVFNFGVIQANIGDLVKLASEKGLISAARQVLDTYYRISDTALTQSPQPDFLVWPETAYPSSFRKPRRSFELSRDQRLEAFVRNRNTPLIFGGYDSNRSIKKDYNSLFYLTPEPQAANGDTDLWTYHKHILLLFGEYIPGAETFDFIAEMFPQVGNFGRGPGAQVHTLTNVKGESLQFNPIICYEILFPWYLIEAARKGSELMINVTNDSWFGPYGEPYLHLALTTFRSVETRIPQIRSTNTGITAFIDPTGELVSQSEIDTAVHIPMEVRVADHGETLMVKWGDWYAKVVVIFSLLMLAWLFSLWRNKTK